MLECRVLALLASGLIMTRTARQCVPRDTQVSGWAMLLMSGPLRLHLGSCCHLLLGLLLTATQLAPALLWQARCVALVHLAMATRTFLAARSAQRTRQSTRESTCVRVCCSCCWCQSVEGSVTMFVWWECSQSHTIQTFSRLQSRLRRSRLPAHEPTPPAAESCMSCLSLPPF